MTINRFAPTRRRITQVVLAVLTLLAPILVTAQVQAASLGLERDAASATASTVGQERGGNPDGCRTIVREFKKNANDMVKLRYQVWCAITQDRIVVTGVITDVHAGVHKQPPATNCYDTYYCDSIVWKADSSSGSTKYWARAANCNGLPICDTIALRDGDSTPAGDMLPCDEPCDHGRVVRSDFF